MRIYKNRVNFISITGIILAVLSMTFGLVFGLGDFSPKPTQPEQTQGATGPNDSSKMWGGGGL